jgi:xanthine dehydrogenase YagR molybdenum-binding subunit
MMRVALSADGRALVETAHLEIGNGIYTVLAIEAAARLGTEIKSVTVRLGDSNFPPASISGGSSTTTSLVPVLAKACNDLRDQLAQIVFPQHPGHDVQMSNCSLIAPDGQSVKLYEAFSRLGKTQIDTVATAAPEGAGEKAIEMLREGKLSLASPEKSLTWAYGAQFAEVHVHSLTGEIRVARMTGAFFAGHIMNRVTAMGQLRGGMIWGIGAALLEATVLDTRTTRFVNDNLAEYLVPTEADAIAVDAILLDAETHPSELMGLGELGIIGVNAALANALHHATGKRYRKLPIRLDDTLESLTSIQSQRRH